MTSSKLFLLFKRSSFKLRCETVIEIVLCYSHQACCLLYTICAKLTMALTFTSLPLNFYTSNSTCGRGFGFKQKILTDRRIWWEKKAGIGGFTYPYSPPLCMKIWGRSRKRLANLLNSLFCIEYSNNVITTLGDYQGRGWFILGFKFFGSLCQSKLVWVCFRVSPEKFRLDLRAIPSSNLSEQWCNLHPSFLSLYCLEHVTCYAVTAMTTPPQKMNLYFTFEVCNFLDLFQLHVKYVAPALNSKSKHEFRNYKISRRRSRSVKYAELSHYTLLLLLSRGRQGNVKDL